MKFNSILILILFCLLSINVVAERETRTAFESDLVDIVSDNSTSFAIPLIEQGIAVDIIDKKGRSLLMLAAKNNNKELVKLLVEKGANPNYEMTDSDRETLIGKTVLDFGADTDDPEMIDLLLELGAKLNVTNGDLRSIAANAYRKGHLKMLRHLLKKGAKISNQTVLYLVVDQILNKVKAADTISLGYDKLMIIDKDKGFKMIKALEDNGVPLNNKALLNFDFVIGSTEKSKKIEDYMSTYRQKIVEGMPDEEIVEVIDNTRNKVRYIYTHDEKQTPEWRILLNLIFFCIKEVLYYLLLSLLWIIGILLFITVIITIINPKAGSNICESIYNGILSFFQKGYKTSLNWLITKIHMFFKFLKNTQKPIVDKGNIPKQIVQIDSSDKGWTVDDTINLEVNYLTIEDVINPIRMTNQHERHVREMIWYVRKVEKTNVDEKQVNDMLVSKWKQVNPRQVRSVYIRSLLIILENYSKQNSIVKHLTKQVKTKAK